MLWCDSRIAKGVLRRLAAYQATAFDPLSDAEPGKVPHEMRGGEMAALREVPFGLYYGSVDATPLFVMLAGLYAEHTGDIETLRELWPNVEAALGWIDGPGDPDRDGFVEYHRADEKGLVNQGWKDSHDAIFHADGSLAQGPIALCEVQGYVYAAKRLAARAARRLGKQALGDALDAQATKLAEQFEAAFWCDDIGTYALALDGQKRPCRVRTSNAGQVLFSGIAAPERAEAVMRDLMRPSFFSGWGIRTVAREEPRYNPMSYHNGSVWPHDNSLIAAGFARYGHKDAIDRVFKGLFDAASLHGPAATARTLLRLPARSRARADALSGRLLAAGLGRRYAAPASAIFSRPRIQPRPQRNLVAQTAASAIPRRGDPAQSASWSIVRRFDAASAWQRRVAPGVAQRGPDYGGRGLFVTPSVGSTALSALGH